MNNQFSANYSDSVRTRLKSRRKKLTNEEPLLETNLNGSKKIKGLKTVAVKIHEFETSQNYQFKSKSPTHPVY
jgi:hypothetical protein